MNYYYKRCKALVWAAVLLVALVPLAAAGGSSLPALCGFLNNRYPVKEDLAAACAKVGFPSMSVFNKEAAAAGYYGTLSDAEKAYEAAKDYLNKCIKDRDAAKDKIAEIEKALKEAKTPEDKAALEQALKEAKQKLDEIEKSKADAEAEIKASEDKLKALQGMSAEEWESMYASTKNSYINMANELHAQATQYAQDASNKAVEAAAQQKKADDSYDVFKAKQAEADMYKAQGKEEEYKKAQEEADKLYDTWKEENQKAYDMQKEADSYKDWATNAENSAVWYENQVNNMTEESYKADKLKEAQAAVDKANEWYNYEVQHAQDQQGYVTQAENALNNYTGEVDQALVDQLEKELATAQSNYEYADANYNDAYAAWQQAEQDLINAQNGGNTQPAQECHMEKECHQEQKKECWKNEDGKEECKYWEEEVCIEKEVCN